VGNYLQKFPYPAMSGGDPGTPGSPYIPGYYSYVSSPVQNPGGAPLGWHYQNVTVPDTLAGNGKTTTAVQLVPNVGTTTYTYPATQPLQQVAVWHPPSPAVAPVPGSSPSYPPDQWDAGAKSIAFLEADGDFTCTVDNGAGGVCVGFAVNLSLDPKNIEFGLYFHSGGVQAFENVPGLPTVTGAFTPYVAADVWILRRRLGVASALKNGTTIYTATNPVRGPKVVQASLYSGFDTVRAAALTTYAGGSVTGSFQKLVGHAGIPQRYVTGTFRLMQGTISAKGHGAVTGSFQKLAGNAGLRQSYVRGSFRNLTATIGSGGFIPAPPQGVRGRLLPMQGVVHGLTGGKGQVTGSFRKLDAMIGKPRQGKVVGSFLPLAAQILANPPGIVYLDSYAAVIDEITVATLLVLNIDSSGVATDAYVVQVTATGSDLESAALAADAWVITQIDTISFDSTAKAYDQMGLGTVLGSLGQIADGSAVWVLNVDTKASTRYESFPYTSLATHAGRLFGTKADGVYLLEGADDAGTPIQSSFATGQLDFADEHDLTKAGALKRVVAAYLGVASDKSMYLKIVANGQEFLYVARASSPTLMQQRVDPGRGLRANYYSFEVFNAQGSDFDLDSLDFVAIKLPRRIP
jgi:hypothetical protein